MKTTSGTLYNIKQLKFCPLECSELHIEVSQPENSCSLYKRGEIKVFNLDQFIRLVLLVSTCTCRRKLRQFFVTIAATSIPSLHKRVVTCNKVQKLQCREAVTVIEKNV